MRRTTCSACGYDDLELFLDLGHSPIADDYTDGARDPAPTYPLQLAVCMGCHLVQLLDVIDHSSLFGAGYSFYSSASKPLSEYHTSYAGDVLHHYADLVCQLTVEVGCNDGDMLRHFSDCRAIGVDPALGPAKVAEERGLTVIKKPFGRAVAEEVREQYGPAGVIIANHVLAHVESVSDVLAGVSHLLDDAGVAFIEVQYLPDLLVNNAFDLVYHEHRNFFSLGSLETACAMHRLHVVDVKLTDRQGGSLRVAVARQRVPSIERDRIIASESWLMNRSAYHGMQGRSERIRDRLLDAIDGVQGTVVGYGAPAKATTLLNFCQVDSTLVDRISDTTPAKQGRYVPGTGIRIHDPADAYVEDAAGILVLAWNYAGSIMRNHARYTARGGRWIVPFPAPVTL